MATARKFDTVVLNGERYIPADERPLDAEARRLLSDAYDILGAEAFYDPDCEATRKFAARVYEKVQAANDLLGFRA